MNSEKNQSQSKAGMLTLFLIVFLDMLGVTIGIPLFAVIFLDTNHSILPTAVSFSARTILLGLLIASYPLAQFFGAPILGALSDKYGRKKLLLLSLIGTFVGYILTALGIILGQVWMLFLSRILDGFTGGNISIALSAIADQSDEKAKAKNFGLIGMAFGLGFIIGPFIGGRLADESLVSWFNLSTPFLFAAVLSFINLMFVILLFKETLHTKRESKISLLTGFQNLAKALRMQNLRTLFLVILLFSFGFSFYTQFFQVYLIEKFHVSEQQIGNIFAYIGLWIAITQGVIMRPLTKRYTPQKILSFSMILLAVAYLLVLVPQKYLLLLLILPFVAVFQGLTNPNTTALLSNSADKSSQGEILGINQSIQSLAQAIPPVIAGFIVAIDKTLPIIVANICTLAAWAVFMVFFQRGKKFHEV